MDKRKLVSIQDEYWEDRESYSEFLNIYCEKCGKYILTYQKDGPGELRRMYLDRIHAPEELTGLQNSEVELKDIKCDECGRLIAAPRIYEKENRKAYFIFAYSVIAKSSDGIVPPRQQKFKLEI